jgi:hypothetical protein
LFFFGRRLECKKHLNLPHSRILPSIPSMASTRLHIIENDVIGQVFFQNINSLGNLFNMC